MIASDALIEIAEKLRQSQKLTALDLHKLYRVANALAQYCGYENIHDTDLYLDALKERSEEEKHAEEA